MEQGETERLLAQERREKTATQKSRDTFGGWANEQRAKADELKAELLSGKADLAERSKTVEKLQAENVRLEGRVAALETSLHAETNRADRLRNLLQDRLQGQQSLLDEPDHQKRHLHQELRSTWRYAMACQNIAQTMSAHDDAQPVARYDSTWTA